MMREVLIDLIVAAKRLDPESGSLQSFWLII